MLKRVMDVALAVALFILLLPLMVVIAILVKLESRGPVLFVQDRLGRRGSIFPMYKFRTMRDGAEKLGTGLCSFEDDPRVTRVGKYIRLLSLDELPQLLNVIRGEMSIVGPRPPVTYELGNYQDLPLRKKVRFRVRPGITGLAQVLGRNALDWEDKIKIDNRYVALLRRYGILIDLKILLQTARVVISTKNVIEKQNAQMAGTAHTSHAKEISKGIHDAEF